MYVIGCISQKGGVGKSTLARDITRQFIASGWRAIIADLDTAQMTSQEWTCRRMENHIDPPVPAQAFPTAERAIEDLAGGRHQLIVFDGKPHSNAETLKVAERAHVIVIPSSPTLDDLEPQFRLGMELLKKGIERRRILYVLNNVTTEIDGREAEEAREYIQSGGFRVAAQPIPRRLSYQNCQNEGRSISENDAGLLGEYAMRVGEEISLILADVTRKVA